MVPPPSRTRFPRLASTQTGLPDTEGQVLARHRSPGGHGPSPELTQAYERARARSGGAHRLAAPPPALRGRIVLAAVAAGAFVAAGSSINPAQSSEVEGITPLAAGAANASLGIGGGGSTIEDTLKPQVLAYAKTDATAQQLESLAKGERIGTERAAREAEARRPLYVLPTVGTFTSSYGPRWGTQHWGIDIANRIGTPIVSAHDGVVVESGPASGFGLWVRVQHEDGTITIYGHIDRSLVREGQRVKAGEQIATMGNRGQSTGPHLHFEVWNAGGAKINPVTWLRSKGLKI